VQHSCGFDLAFKDSTPKILIHVSLSCISVGDRLAVTAVKRFDTRMQSRVEWSSRKSADLSCPNSILAVAIDSFITKAKVETTLFQTVVAERSE